MTPDELVQPETLRVSGEKGTVQITVDRGMKQVYDLSHEINLKISTLYWSMQRKELTYEEAEEKVRQIMLKSDCQRWIALDHLSAIGKQNQEVIE